MSLHVSNVAELIQCTPGASCTKPRHPSLVSFHSEMDRDVVAQKQDSRMRLEFERVMYKELGIPDRYQNVAVLIVRWENDLDKELKCWREVSYWPRCTLSIVLTLF